MYGPDVEFKVRNTIVSLVWLPVVHITCKPKWQTGIAITMNVAISNLEGHVVSNDCDHTEDYDVKNDNSRVMK